MGANVACCILCMSLLIILDVLSYDLVQVPALLAQAFLQCFLLLGLLAFHSIPLQHTGSRKTVERTVARDTCPAA